MLPRLINVVVANNTSINTANSFSSTIETTRIAAAHIIDCEITNYVAI